MGSTELFGSWHLPGGRPVDGRLIVDDGRPTLQLRKPLGSAGRIEGQLTNGEPVTLFGVDMTRRGSGDWAEDLLIHMAVLGMNLASESDKCLTGATILAEGLEEAVGVSNLSVTTSDLTKKSGASASVEWRATEPIEVALAEGTLVLDSFVRFDHESWFRFALEHRAKATLAAPKSLALADVHRVFDRLLALLAFATAARVGTDALRVSSAAGEAEVIARERQRYGPSPHDGEAWLEIGGLDDPAAAVAGFYRFADEQPAAYLVLFEYLVFESALNPADKLLYLARFLEVYHRTRYPGPRDPEDVHNERVALVKQAAGESHKTWVNQIVFHSNDVTFKQRVRAIVEGPAALAAPVLGATVDKFAKVVGDSRNYWTHYSEDLESKALRDVSLDDLDDRLLLVVRACVLDHMGVSQSDAQSALQRDSRWRRRAADKL